MDDNTDKMGLNEFISRLKKELLSDHSLLNKEDTVPFFAVEEVTVEVNFVTRYDGNIGAKFWVISADARESNETAQKAIIRMKPILPVKDLILEIYPDLKEKTKESLKEYLEKNFPDFQEQFVNIPGKSLKGHRTSEEDI